MEPRGADTCGVCGRQAETVDVYSMRYMPLSLGLCHNCVDNRAYPIGLVKWAMGKAPCGDSERHRYFAEVAQVPDGDGYRWLTPEELDNYESEGRRRWAALDAEVAEARRSVRGG